MATKMAPDADDAVFKFDLARSRHSNRQADRKNRADAAPANGRRTDRRDGRMDTGPRRRWPPPPPVGLMGVEEKKRESSREFSPPRPRSGA